MRKIFARSLLAALMATAAFTVGAAPVSAATVIDFGSGTGGTGGTPYVENNFTFQPNTIVNGPCDLGKPCLALNNNETSVMTFAGGSFDLLGLSFSLLGEGTGQVKGNIFTVTQTGTLNSISFSVADFLKNVWHTVTFGSQFLNVTSITYSTSLGGNVRIDNILASCLGCPNEIIPVPEVPIPAALPLLLGGLGGLALLGRRQRRRDFTAA